MSAPTSPIVPVTSLDDPALAPFARLTDPQLRSRLDPEMGILIAEGLGICQIALQKGLQPLAMLTEEKHVTGKAAPLIAALGGAPVYVAPAEQLARLTGYPLTRGVLTAFYRPAPRDAHALVAGAHRLAVLEQLNDAANLGALFRSAAALGLDGLLLTPDCCDPYARRALRVSMGGVLQLPWARLEAWPGGGIRLLKEAGFVTCALALTDKSVPIDDPRLKAADRLALILGAEGPGLRQETLALADFTARIPMCRGVDSLNVAAAGAVAFWETRRREPEPIPPEE